MQLSNKEKKLISAVVYVHNDEDRIVPFLEQLVSLLSARFEMYEVIVVDDCSFDDSVGRLRNSPELKGRQISVISLSIAQGIEAAMTAGIDMSMGDFVYEFDDLRLDYDPALIFEAYRRIASGADIVSVAPGKSSQASSRLFYALFNRYSRSKYRLQSERFRILSRRAINRAYSISTAVPYRKALYANSGLKLETIGYEPLFHQVVARSGHGVFRNRMALNSLVIYTNVAFRLSILITAVLFAFTLFAGLYALVIFFGKEKPIEGWTTTMLLLSAGFSGVFFVLAIIIKYLSLLVELIYSKKAYLVENVEKL